MSPEVYADHAATTPVAPEVFEAMRPWLESGAVGNASSVHSRGERAREAIEAARARVARLAGAAAEEIVFTASGSEANNLALKGAAAVAPEGRRRLVVSAIEHLSVLETARHLESRGHPLTVVPVERDGVVDPARVAAALEPDVALVAVMLVNNETGTVQPIAEIAALARAAGARVHCDAVQAAGKLPLAVEALGVDSLSLAGHKFHGPPGGAALWLRRRHRIVPLVHGGHQERSRRAGTENVPAIVGLGAAAERAMARLAANEPERIGALADRLLDGLLQSVPGAILNGDRVRRIRSILNIEMPGVDGEALLHALDQDGIQVSTGSACSAANPGPSHVLTAMGRSAEAAHASVRFSLGEGIDESQVEYMIRTVPSAASRLRELASRDSA
jgi:cysteine desulfurase